ncbi:MAG: acyl-CoA dehydrogenase family protein [Pseudomonadota bacterium]|nr:acyl-CoA dehydrogenase family protein [Pseudomonadota bacterium]
MATITEMLPEGNVKPPVMPDDYVKPSAMLERARALVPVIRASQEKTESDRRVPSDLFEQILDAGLFRMLMPRRFGGYEHGMDVFAEAAYEIARGCGSVGWVHSICSMYQYLLAMFPLEAQEEIWADDQYGCTSASFIPTGTAIKGDQDYTVSGTWAYCSGVDNCSWLLVAVNVVNHGDENPVERGYIVAPKSEFNIKDDWYAAGLAGTGSKTVFCENLRIPSHRYLSLEDTMSGNPPGAKANPAPLYTIPTFQALSISVAAPIIGISRGAYDCFMSDTSARVTRGSALANSGPMAQLPSIHTRIGKAAASIDAAKLLVLRDAKELMQTYIAGDSQSEEIRARNKGDLGFAAHLAVSGLDTIFEANGAGGLQLSSNMQRYWRDAHAGSMHISVNQDAVLGLYGRVHLGLPAGPAQF